MTTNISKAQLARLDAYQNIVGMKEALHGDASGPTDGDLVIPPEIDIVSVSLRDPTGTYLLYSDGAGGITEVDASAPTPAAAPVAPVSSIVLDPAPAPVPAAPVVTEAPVAVPAAIPAA